jgi:hypothetical protein
LETCLKWNNSATLQSTQWIINAAYDQRSLQSTPLFNTFPTVITTSVVQDLNEKSLALIVWCVDYTLRCTYHRRASEMGQTYWWLSCPSGGASPSPPSGDRLVISAQPSPKQRSVKARVRVSSRFFSYINFKKQKHNFSLIWKFLFCFLVQIS